MKIPEIWRLYTIPTSLPWRNFTLIILDPKLPLEGDHILRLNVVRMVY